MDYLQHSMFNHDLRESQFYEMHHWTSELICVDCFKSLYTGRIDRIKLQHSEMYDLPLLPSFPSLFPTSIR